MCSKEPGEFVDVDRSGHLKQVSLFKSLGSVVCEESGCEVDVWMRMRAA